MMTKLAALFGVCLILQPAADPVMKAAAYQEGGVLAYSDVKRPAVAAGQVLIRVRAAGVNPIDWKLPPRSGFIPGFDVSGIVEAVGEGVTAFKAGDEVFAMLPLGQTGGGYAQFAVAAQDIVVVKPANLSHSEAASIPLAALTAYQALFDTANLKQGQTILIHGGSGGVGHFAIQLAKSRGARVITTASKENHEFVKSLGADVVVDYKTEKFEDVAKEVDVVLDVIGGDTQRRSYSTLKPGGILVSIVGRPANPPANIKAQGILVHPSGSQLAKLIADGKLKPEVGKTFPLTEAAAAHAQGKSGSHRGKIVLLVE